MSRQIVLTVHSGLHSGAATAVPEGIETVLGRGPDCGIVLADAGIADRHFSLRAERRRLVVTALDGAVDVPGRGRIEPGFRSRLPRSVDLGIGGVALRAEMRPPPRALRAGLVLPAAIALAGLGGAIATHLPLIPQAVAGRVADEVAEPAASRRGAPAAAPEVAAAPDRSTIATLIRARLADAGLGDLSLVADEETFALSGPLPTDRRPDVHSVQAWFDDAFPHLVLRSSGVSFQRAPHAETRAPVIESVWTLGAPYLVIGGRRYHPGDTVPNGWRLGAIEDERAVFTEGDRTHRVTLGAAADGDGGATR